jgi:hypothetical protein
MALLLGMAYYEARLIDGRSTRSLAEYGRASQVALLAATVKTRSSSGAERLTLERLDSRAQ